MGAKPLKRQVARSSVVGVLSGTDMAQAVGTGTPMVKATARTGPKSTAFFALSDAEYVPGVVGVPVMMPLVGSSISSPGGRPVAT